MLDMENTGRLLDRPTSTPPGLNGAATAIEASLSPDGRLLMAQVSTSQRLAVLGTIDLMVWCWAQLAKLYSLDVPNQISSTLMGWL